MQDIKDIIAIKDSINEFSQSSITQKTYKGITRLSFQVTPSNFQKVLNVINSSEEKFYALLSKESVHDYGKEPDYDSGCECCGFDDYDFGLFLEAIIQNYPPVDGQGNYYEVV